MVRCASSQSASTFRSSRIRLRRRRDEKMTFKKLDKIRDLQVICHYLANLEPSIRLVKIGRGIEGMALGAALAYVINKQDLAAAKSS